MKKRLVLLSLLLVFALVFSAGCGGSNQPADDSQQPDVAEGDNRETTEELKVAMIINGPANDGGWALTHTDGLHEAAEAFENVKVTIVENVAENSDSERVLTQLCEQGNKLIFAASFGYMDYVLSVAEKYPDVKFMHATGYKQAPNVSVYFGRAYQSRYLTGLVAGMMTETNKIGYVAAHPIPEVVRGINAFTLGVKEVNPDAEVQVVWSNTWYDPAAEKEAALGLLEAGCDVIAQHQNTPGPQQAAQEKGAFGVGYNADMRHFAPEANLTSPVWNWTPYYTRVIGSVLDGTWESENYWGTIGEGITDIGPYGDMVPEEVREVVAEKRELLVSGQWDVFYGPIKDQSGEIRVPEGSQMTDEELLSFDWFVDGVVGNL